MQQPDKTPPAIKGLFFYFRDIIRFHDAGTPRFVQVLFVLMLAVLYGSMLLMAPYVKQLDILYQGIMNTLLEAPDNETALKSLETLLTPEKRTALIASIGSILGITLIARVLAQGMAILYGYVWHQGHLPTNGGANRGSADASVRTLQGLPAAHTVHASLRAFLFRLPRLVAVNALFYVVLLAAGIALSVVFGILGVLVPIFAVLLYILIPMLYLVATALFAFKDLSVLSGRTRVLETFPVSWKLTRGSRRILVGNMVLLNVLAMLISSLAGGNAAGSPAAAFVVTFLDVIMLLVTQRLVVRMYEDARGIRTHREEPRNP